MTEQQEAELKRLREADDNWTGPKLLSIVAGTLVVAFAIIYVISGFNGGH